MNFVRQTAKEPGLEDRVRILGFVSRDELVYLCRNAYALAYPSFFDPDSINGRVYLEGHGIELEDGQLAELNLCARPDHARLLPPV